MPNCLENLETRSRELDLRCDIVIVIDGIALQSGLEAAANLLGTNFQPLPLVKQMTFTYLEFATRLVVTSFFQKFIRTGHVQ